MASDDDRIILTFNKKVRRQLVELKEQMNVTSYAEVVRRALDLLAQQYNTNNIGN